MMKQAVALLTFLVFLFLFGGVMPIVAQQDEDLGEDASTWNGESRFTVLILGIDRRPTERDVLPARTDLMILASIDPGQRSIGLLDLPRDLHMTPPGSDEFERINTLMRDGEVLQDGYGPYWVMDTLEYNLGMYVDRYVLFDFEAFQTIIDAMGGVEITTQYPINDDTFPDMDFGYDPFYLPAGTHVLDGRDALRFVRTRHGDNDIVRGQRQLQLIQAVHDQLREGRTLYNLLQNAPQLQQDLREHIQTDLTLGDIAFLVRYVSLIDPENIVARSLDDDYTLSYATPGGQRVPVPDRSTVSELMVQVFGENYNQ